MIGIHLLHELLRACVCIFLKTFKEERPPVMELVVHRIFELADVVSDSVSLFFPEIL